MQAALTTAKEHLYQGRIVWRMDRLTDNPGQLLRMVGELVKDDVTIAYATEPDTNTDTISVAGSPTLTVLFQVQPERKTSLCALTQ